MQTTLFKEVNPVEKQVIQNSYFTPQWASSLLWDFFLSKEKTSLVCEPNCGTGNMLSAIPADINAYGVEIDSDLSAIARSTTKREVITSDFLNIKILPTTDTFFGNPPFVLDFFIKMLSKIHHETGPDTNCGFIIPAYFLQTTGTVCEISNNWSIKPNLIPRNLFKDLSKPLLFCMFKKEKIPNLENMVLYWEHSLFRSLPKWLQEELNTSSELASRKSGGWKSAVASAIKYLGEKFTLDDLYRFFACDSHRPTNTIHWKAKIRQTLYRYFSDCYNPS